MISAGQKQVNAAAERSYQQQAILRFHLSWLYKVCGDCVPVHTIKLGRFAVSERPRRNMNSTEIRQYKDIPHTRNPHSCHVLSTSTNSSHMDEESHHAPLSHTLHESKERETFSAHAEPAVIYHAQRASSRLPRTLIRTRYVHVHMLNRL